MVYRSPKPRTGFRLGRIFSFLVNSLPLIVLSAIFGLFDVPPEPLQVFAAWFLTAPLADWHVFNVVLGSAFAVGLGALYGTDWRRKRSLIALLVGVPAVTVTALAVAILDRPSLTPAGLALGLAASAAFWALGSHRGRID